MANDPARVSPALNRELLRSAGEHLGALAEEAHVQLSWHFTDHRERRRLAERYAALSTLSRRVLEIANA
jgi:hypothetical protein